MKGNIFFYIAIMFVVLSGIECLRLQNTQSHLVGEVTSKYANHMRSFMNHNSKQIVGNVHNKEPPVELTNAFSRLNQKNPTLFQKFVAGKLSDQEKNQVTQTLLQDKQFSQGMLKNAVLSIADSQNCLKNFSLTDEQKRTIVSLNLKVSDWNKAMTVDDYQNTPEQFKTFVASMSNDSTIGSQIANCIQKIQEITQKNKKSKK